MTAKEETKHLCCNCVPQKWATKIAAMRKLPVNSRTELEGRVWSTLCSGKIVHTIPDQWLSNHSFKNSSDGVYSQLGRFLNQRQNYNIIQSCLSYYYHSNAGIAFNEPELQEIHDRTKRTVLLHISYGCPLEFTIINADQKLQHNCVMKPWKSSSANVTVHMAITSSI